MWESYGALGSVVLTAIGLYFTIRKGIRSDRRQKELDARSALQEAIDKATKPYKDRIVELTEDHAREIAELQLRVSEIQDSQERVIDNATIFFRDRIAELERDRDYWRNRNNAPRPNGDDA